MSDTKKTDAGVAAVEQKGCVPPLERVFIGADSAQWRVYEQRFANYDRRQGLSLIFASDGAVRRVRNYPADWALISDEELIQLSWNV